VHCCFLAASPHTDCGLLHSVSCGLNGELAAADTNTIVWVWVLQADGYIAMTCAFQVVCSSEFVQDQGNDLFSIISRSARRSRCYIPSLPLTPVQPPALTAEPAGSVTPPCPTSEQANHQHHLKLQQLLLLPPGQARPAQAAAAAADPLQILPASLHRSGRLLLQGKQREAMARLDCVAALLGWAALRRYDVYSRPGM
jgi:hypothetical protein